MRVDANTLREKYKKIDDSTLMELYSNGTLTEIAIHVIREELTSRGYSDDKITNLNSEKKHKIKQERLQREKDYNLRGIENISCQYKSGEIVWWRALATGLDYVFIMIFIVVIFYFQDTVLNRVDPLSTFLLVMFYYILCEWYFGKTIGKAITKISVVNIDGKKPNLWQSLIRTLTRIIEVNPSLIGGIPAFISVMLTKKNQRIGDIFAKTYVIRDIDLYRDEIAPENKF